MLMGAMELDPGTDMEEMAAVLLQLQLQQLSGPSASSAVSAAAAEQPQLRHSHEVLATSGAALADLHLPAVPEATTTSNPVVAAGSSGSSGGGASMVKLPRGSGRPATRRAAGLQVGTSYRHLAEMEEGEDD